MTTLEIILKVLATIGLLVLPIVLAVWSQRRFGSATQKR